jgi:hypothetical protein
MCQSLMAEQEGDACGMETAQCRRQCSDTWSASLARDRLGRTACSSMEGGQQMRALTD